MTRRSFFAPLWMILAILALLAGCRSLRSAPPLLDSIPVGEGWAGNSVNTAVFRKNSLVSWRDTQFVAYYSGDGYVVLGKRSLNSRQWQLKQTSFRGRVSDAHNVISIMVDGSGYLHLAWDHHNNRLHYARSLRPGSLDFGPEQSMTGRQEDRVSYPEFYRLPGGQLLFLYRDGGSGGGNLVVNRYDPSVQQWTQLHSNLVDGEKKRNAYWQACVDDQGALHLSWVWRESPDVASNHDLCYAVSRDGGKSWERSNGQQYTLPITAAGAEQALAIPQRSELINQTSMFADAQGRPYIASYWRDSNSTVPQYHLVYRDEAGWKVQDLGFRKTPFSLSGGGTKRIPLSRPQIIAQSRGGATWAALLFRDEERGSLLSAAVCTNLSRGRWTVMDLDKDYLGSWEPTYDTELWKDQGKLHLFVQRTEQVDGEGLSNTAPTTIKIMEWKPSIK